MTLDEPCVEVSYSTVVDCRLMISYHSTASILVLLSHLYLSPLDWIVASGFYYSNACQSQFPERDLFSGRLTSSLVHIVGKHQTCSKNHGISWNNDHNDEPKNGVLAMSALQQFQ